MCWLDIAKDRVKVLPIVGENTMSGVEPEARLATEQLRGVEGESVMMFLGLGLR